MRVGRAATRRGGHPADRRAPPADPLRLATDPQRRRGSHPAGAAAATAAPSRTGRSPAPQRHHPARPSPWRPRQTSPSGPAHARLGSEGLARLRARYADVVASIDRRTQDEHRRQQLTEQAERLNPDNWVTDDEVARALEDYETVLASLRDAVGRRRRRKRPRPGGQGGPRRGRGRRQPDGSPAPPDETTRTRNSGPPGSSEGRAYSGTPAVVYNRPHASNIPAAGEVCFRPDSHDDRRRGPGAGSTQARFHLAR